jgi:hypothetical protein
MDIDLLNVRLERDNPNEIIEIVRELRFRGYVQGTDFDFKFVPIQIDPESYQTINKKHTMFIFYREELASWFTLLYQ